MIAVALFTPTDWLFFCFIGMRRDGTRGVKSRRFGVPTLFRIIHNDMATNPFFNKPTPPPPSLPGYVIPAVMVYCEHSHALRS